MEDAKFERRMRDWERAERAAREAEKAASLSPDLHADALQTLEQQARRLRRVADAIHASILEDIQVHRPRMTPPPPRAAQPRRPDPS